MPTTNAPDPALRGRFRTADPEVAAVSSSTLGTNEGRGSMDQCTQPCWASGEARNRAGTAGRGGVSGKKPGCLSMSTIHHDTTRHAQNPVQSTNDAYCRRRQDGCTPWLPRYVGFFSMRLCYDATCLLFVRVLDDFWRGSMGLQRIQFSQCQWMGSRWTRPALLGFPPLASCMPGLARIPSDARRPAPTTTGSVSPRVRQIYPRPPPFVHSLWGCCRRPLNSRCRRRRHDRIGQS